ncbi:hypothetical protein AB0M00_44015 [Streptomyces chartreusis]|uniref:hypothetical protein n=1 Tax=Streptomyces chartreusis TaxID=1969 RepID=UPI0034127674
MTSTNTTANGWAALEKRLDGIPKPTRTLALCADPDVRDRYQAAKQAHQRASNYLQSLPKNAEKDARALATSQVAEAAAHLEAVKQEYDAITVTLTFQALERGELEDLRSQHPATEEDEELGRDFHFDTFAPALISASSVDGMPVEYAQQAMKKWSLTDSDDLWNVAWAVQQRKRSDLGKG